MCAVPPAKPVDDRLGAPAPPRTRRALGQRGEDLAVEHLARLGFAQLARNVRTRHGEIDVIAFDGHTIVFAEVKTRRVRKTAAAAAGAAGTHRVQPLEGLRPRQRARLQRLACAWLSAAGTDRPHADVLRFDAIGVLLDERGGLVRLDHLEAAW